MSFKIAAESLPILPPGAAEKKVVVVVVRGYEEERDKVAVEELERRCEIGQRGKPSLVTDLLGDPICRVRNFPSHVMLVAEYGEEREIVGVIRGCVKTVTNGRKASSSSSSSSSDVPGYVKLAYILGLRVSPTHRRLGTGTKLVQHLEEWCKQKGADYAYMATDCTNEPSINLFTMKCNYHKFRTPTMLVHPVHAHHKPLGSSATTIVRLPPQLAESIYRRVFADSEFFPRDIDRILSNRLSLGTFMAVPSSTNTKSLPKWDPQEQSGILLLPPSFALISIWNTKQVFKLQVKGASRLTYAWCAGSRVLDSLMPWLNIPSIPNVFRPFGVYFLYGLFMQGKGASRLMKSLCAFAHNMARDDDEGGCGALVAEVGQRDPVREAIPHWRKFSWAEDLWCMKKLAPASDEGYGPSDWIKSQSSSSVIFVDPRDF